LEEVSFFFFVGGGFDDAGFRLETSLGRTIVVAGAGHEITQRERQRIAHRGIKILKFNRTKKGQVDGKKS
jgi:hypothetical protein